MSKFVKKLKQLYRQTVDTIFGFIVIACIIIGMIVSAPFILLAAIVGMLILCVIMVLRNYNSNNYKDDEDDSSK
jgi:hypothetical protein